MSIFTGRKAEKTQYHPRPETKYGVPLTAAALKSIFADCSDFEARPVSIPGGRVRGVTLCFLDGVVSGKDTGEDVLRPLTDPMRLSGVRDARQCMERMATGAVYSYTVKEHSETDDVVTDILQGFAAVIFDSENAALCFEVKTGNVRGISEPQVEKTLKGAKDAFVETIRINTSLVRRKLRLSELKIRQTTVGRKSRTHVAMLWIDGVADPALLEELQARVSAIDIDGLIAAGNLEEYIVDCPRSPFPQLLHTERPDKFAINLLEGRVGLLVDGLPIGFLLPATFSEFMKVAEDNAQQYVTASVLTVLRWLAFLLSLVLPALLVAVAMYDQEMLPTKLLLSMVEAKQKVPFNVAVEVLSMLVAFELLQEAGLRLPDPVGQTISIIGALIVGQSAVEARVISPIPVIIVALAGIAGYTLPSRDMGAAIRICRFLLVLAAVAAGMFGLVAGLVLFIWHLCRIESFGVPYLSPLAEGEPGALRRVFLRARLSKSKLRHEELNTPDKRNQK